MSVKKIVFHGGAFDFSQKFTEKDSPDEIIQLKTDNFVYSYEYRFEDQTAKQWHYYLKEVVENVNAAASDRPPDARDLGKT